MDEWHSCTLGDLVTLHYGKALPAHKRVIGEIPVYSSAGLTGYHNEALLHSRGLIIGRKGTIGKIYRSDTPFFVIDTAFYIGPDDKKYNFDYLYYLLQTLGLEELNEDSAVPGLNRDTAYSQELDVPQCLYEQSVIAGVLSSLDDKIDLLHRQNKTLEALAETLFRQWFIEEVQDDWKTVCIGDVAKTNLSTVRVDHPIRNIQYLDTGSITEGKIEALQPLNLKDAPSRARRLVKHNDIIISTVRPNHKHYGFIKNPPEDLVVSTGFCVVTCTDIDPHFMYLFLTQADMTEYLSIVAEASTTTYPSLKPSDIEAIEFQLPPSKLLGKFSVIASDAWEKIEANYEQMRYLENLRETLLPKLMSGEVRVQYEDAV